MLPSKKIRLARSTQVTIHQRNLFNVDGLLTKALDNIAKHGHV
jgi:hypothetical protein